MANIRDLMNLVSGATVVTESQILTEAQNYDDMFSKLAKFVKVAKPAVRAGSDSSKSDEEIEAELAKRWTPEFRETYAQEHVINVAKSEIQWARKTLKRNDRIVWYLRFARLNIIKNLSRVFDADPFEQMFDAEVKMFRQKGSNRQGDWLNSENSSGNDNWYETVQRFASNLGYLSRQLEHYMSYEDKIAKIHSYVFSWQLPPHVFEDLGEFEEEWKKERKGLIRATDDDEDKPVIEFTDGFAWVLLDRAYCEDEGEAMGHCGNRGSPANGDRILSLRRKVMVDNAVHWRPSLTFILDKDGMLGEMKGRGNDKPAEKYHRHIVSLLESDYVKGIKGGGYMPENNFSMSDLDDELAETLMDKKPALATPFYYWSKNGVDETLMKMLRDLDFQKSVNRNYPSLVKFSPDGKTALLAEFDNIGEFIEYFGESSTVELFQEVYEGGGNEPYGTEEPGPSGRETVWDDLGKADRHAIGLYLLANEEDGIRGWCEQEGYEFEEFDPKDSSDVLGVIEFLDDDWVQALDSGNYTGQENGAQDEISTAIKKDLLGGWALNHDLDNGTLEYDEETRKGFKPDQLIFDEKCYLGTTTESFLRFASNGAPEDFDGYMVSEIEVDSPYYGWQGYSSESAVERFKEEAPDYREFLKQLQGSEEEKKAD